MKNRSSSVQPYTQADLEIGFEAVKALHGIKGYDGWAEHIAKVIARTRASLQPATPTIDDRTPTAAQPAPTTAIGRVDREGGWNAGRGLPRPSTDRGGK